jgi:uncharacterized protein
MTSQINRVSNYTIHTKLNGGVLLINSLTGAIDELNDQTWESCQFGSPDPDVKRYLKYRGHLTNLDRDAERDYALRVWAELDKNSRKRGAVVICPSMDCNFRCTYCFERALQDRIDSGAFPSPKANLTLDQVDEIFNFLPRLLEHHSELQENITLFGGEPLWARNYEVVSKIVSEGRLRGYTLSAITNGYDLSTFSSLLGANGISMIQISLDGPPEIHDGMRLTVLGERTFDRIIEQLRSVLAIDGLQIQIRMNYDSKNLGKVQELLDILRQKEILGRSNVSFHANLISMNHSGLGKDYKTLKLLPILAPQVSGFELDCYTSGLREGLRNSLDSEEPFFRKAHFCAATSGMYVFCPDNKIYSCWEGIGEEHSLLGTFGPGAHFHEEGMTRWQRRNALSMPACQTCSHLFFCGGGCAVHALEKTGNINTSECDGIRKKFEVMVQNVFRERGEHDVRFGVSASDVAKAVVAT